MKSQALTFEQLIAREHERLDGLQKKSPAGNNGGAVMAGTPPKSRFAPPGLVGEPWVSFTAKDRFGLALSGGGIRSATFNLGLLQGLQQEGLLEHVDYLSTVSGGGYIGGFWTAWRHHRNGGSQSLFPGQTSTNGGAAGRKGDNPEPTPIRHLREFSRFLIPRFGLFRLGLWQAIVTILGGLLPSLAAATAVLALGLYVWFFATFWLVALDASQGAALLAAATLLILLVGEMISERATKDRRAPADSAGYVGLAVITSVWIGSIWWACRGHHLAEWQPLAWLDTWFNTHRALWSPEWPFVWSAGPALRAAPFAPALAWVVIGGLLLLVRTLSSRLISPKVTVGWSATLDRVIARCLQPAMVWTALALLWEACHWAVTQYWKTDAALVTGGGALGAGALFVLLRDWLTKPTEENRATQLLATAVEKLKPLAPQLLANATVLLMLACVCLFVQYFGLGDQVWQGFGLTVGLILLTLLLFNPARVGLHDFYRARICRCYLGAAGSTPANYRRDPAERPGDDVTFGELAADAPGERHRPIHLVCCAANNLAGDPMASLYRGARSAVLSPFGIALGNHAAPLDHLRLSSALTASAAAFNSQMGRRSMNLGPAVAFLMSALNLRLGLWVKHPLNPYRRYFVLTGLPFFYEMFGLTDCDDSPAPAQPPAAATGTNAPAAGTTPPMTPPRGKIAQGLSHLSGATARTVQQAGQGVSQANDFVRRSLSDLHLSDGAHFENLGLYELVRRHCRYIIVSDCGEDPEVAFDDLAIALRSVREDFGVEIDLETSPLRPDEHGRSRQHAVVGTIHYDGLAGLDKGTILYFKPALTGDEPPDVLQYLTRNPAFPHESTGDQFYDEAQWESYRRLGQHATAVVLRFVEKLANRREDSARFVENVFLNATSQWHPGPERQGEVFLALTERFTELETDIRDHAPAFLRAEFFPEAAAVLGLASAVPRTADDEIRALYYVMLVAQLMEDAWIGADLDNYWSHPLNDGWMNYAQRWASTPSFRRWWPVLRPIYSIGFRDFVRERFDLAYHNANAPESPGARLELRPLATLEGLSWEHWRRRQSAPTAVAAAADALEYRLTLDAVAPAGPLPSFQAGVLLYRVVEAPGELLFAEWRSEDLFVSHSLLGAGIIARFLDGVLEHFRWSGVNEVHVVFDQRRSRADPANRRQRLHDINFYKSRGFVCEEPAPPGGNLRLVRRWSADN